GVAVSPDGRYVYVAGAGDDAIVVFRRDECGDLSHVTTLFDGQDGVSGLDDVRDIVVSPDGLSLYIVAAQGDSLVVFSRDPDSGALTFQAMYQDGDGIDGRDGAFAIAVSGDGKNIYVGTEIDAGVATFAREVNDPPVFVEYGEPVPITPWAKLTDV